MNKVIELNKPKKLKKGDKVQIKGADYIVREFRTIQSDKGAKKLNTKKISLIKEDGKGHLKGKYLAMQNEKTGETKFYKGIEQREISPNSFKFQSVKSMFYSKLK